MSAHAKRTGSSVGSSVGVVASLACGLLFGGGLVVSGMTDPAKVQAFLDVRGAWDPSLALVMGSAVATCAAFYAYARRRAPRPASSAQTKRVDARLVSGAAIFGVGWGLVGACPGPAIVALGAGATWSIVFVAAMTFGGFLEGVTAKRASRESDRVSEPDVAPLGSRV